MRCNMGFNGRLTLVGACALVLSAGSAQANTVNVEYTGAGVGRNVNVTSTLSGFNGGVSAKVLNLSIGSVDSGSALKANTNYVAFCAELAQFANGDELEYHEDSLANLPEPVPAMGADAATAIKRMWAFAGDQKFTDSDWATAFQVAVWEVVDEYTGTDPVNLNISEGRFKVNSGLNTNRRDIVDDLLTAALNENQAQANLIGLWRASGNQAQDYIVEVPEPSSIALLAIGGACVAGNRLRRRRVQA